MDQRYFKGINESWNKRKLQIIEIGEKKQVLVKGHPYMSWEKGDESSERLAIAQLYDIGIASQDELAQTFGFHVNTVAKYISAYRMEGAKGLIDQMRGPKEKWKINPEMKEETQVDEGVYEKQKPSLPLYKCISFKTNEAIFFRVSLTLLFFRFS